MVIVHTFHNYIFLAISQVFHIQGKFAHRVKLNLFNSCLQFSWNFLKFFLRSSRQKYLLKFCDFFLLNFVRTQSFVLFQEKFKTVTSMLGGAYSTFELENLSKSFLIYNDRELHTNSLKHYDGSSPPLTGYCTWLAAQVMAKYLVYINANTSSLQGKRILDLGAGTGYVGIVATVLG